MNQKMSYTPSKIRGLRTTASEQAIFTILALNHGASFLQTIRPAATVTFAEAVSVKTSLLRGLAPAARAVLLDPVYGLAPAVWQGALPGHVGLLLSAGVDFETFAGPGPRAIWPDGPSGKRRPN